MVATYCVKDRRKTPNVTGSERTVVTKNGRNMLKAKCAVCGITKTRFLPGGGKNKMSGEGSPIPFPFVDLGKAWSVLSDSTLFKGPEVSEEEGMRIVDGFRQYNAYKRKEGTRSYGSWIKWKGYGRGLTRGKEVDVHAMSSKLPTTKKGWTLPGHKYTGPYNHLDKQVKYDPETGNILEIYDLPTGATDRIALSHDVDYATCSHWAKKYGESEKQCKRAADEKMVQTLDALPWKYRQWGHALARNAINAKQKLGLGAG